MRLLLEERRQFADNLRSLRKRRGLSQEALGDVAGIHRTEVSLLERSGRDPRLSTLVRLARALGVPVSRLLRGIT